MGECVYVGGWAHHARHTDARTEQGRNGAPESHPVEGRLRAVVAALLSANCVLCLQAPQKVLCGHALRTPGHSVISKLP